MEPNLRKFLHVLVREVLARSDGSYVIEGKRRDHTHLSFLREAGYIAGNDLTDAAFREFFATFENLDCTKQVQGWVDDLGVQVTWKRAKGLVLQQLGDDYGVTRGDYVFIKDGAKISTWFHELGHIAFSRIERDLLARLEAAVRKHYTIRSAQELEGGVLHAITNQPCTPLDGIYLTMNGRHHGLDHNGPDAILDEMWAIMFETYCDGLDLKQEVKSVVEEIIAALRATPTAAP